MNFTTEELEELAEFVCGRVESLKDMSSSPNLPKATKNGMQKAIKDLASLDIKLRPYYKART